MPYKDSSKKKQYYRDYARQNGAKKRQSVKVRVVEMFGGGCVMCGFADIRALQIDHIVRIKRSKSGTHSGSTLWRRVLGGIIPVESVQLLCANCHAIKTYEERNG